MENLILKTLESASAQFDLVKLIWIGVTLALAVAVIIALVIIGKKMKKRFAADGDIKKLHIITVAFKAARITVIVVALVMILQFIGINMSVFVIIFGALGIVGFFAIKDSFQDIFTGFILMSDHYFTVGDAVEFEGRDGIVVYFTVRTTKIEYLDDRSVASIANRNISKIRKLTHLTDIDLPLSYELDRKTAFSVLTEICRRIGDIEGVEKCELKGTQEFSPSAVVYKIRFFCEPNDRPDIRREAHRLIQDGLAENGIRIPYDQIDVHNK